MVQVAVPGREGLDDYVCRVLGLEGDPDLSVWESLVSMIERFGQETDVKLAISLNATTWAGRIGVLVVPPIAYWVTYRICICVQRSDRAVLEEVVMVGYLFTRWRQAGWSMPLAFQKRVAITMLGNTTSAVMTIRDALARHGLDVPIREIHKVAEQRNASAIQYHFGSKDELLAAIRQEQAGSFA